MDVLATAVPTDRGSETYRDKFSDLAQFRVDQVLSSGDHISSPIGGYPQGYNLNHMTGTKAFKLVLCEASYVI